MNNSKELTNRKYLSDGTEIRGTGKGGERGARGIVPSSIRVAVKWATGYTYCLYRRLRELSTNIGLLMIHE